MDISTASEKGNGSYEQCMVPGKGTLMTRIAIVFEYIVVGI
jgi:hypothetical protein